jgi:hypothetical protein
LAGSNSPPVRWLCAAFWADPRGGSAPARPLLGREVLSCGKNATAKKQTINTLQRMLGPTCRFMAACARGSAMVLYTLYPGYRLRASLVLNPFSRFWSYGLRRREIELTPAEFVVPRGRRSRASSREPAGALVARRRLAVKSPRNRKSPQGLRRRFSGLGEAVVRSTDSQAAERSPVVDALVPSRNHG